MLNITHDVVYDVLILVYGLPNLGLFTLGEDIEMSVTHTALLIYLRKLRYAGHLQWDIMRKSTKARRK